MYCPIYNPSTKSGIRHDRDYHLSAHRVCPTAAIRHHHCAGGERETSARTHPITRPRVNQSKGGDDIDEWSDAAIASSTACGGGYAVTAAGRCFLARTTVSVKSKWELAVDQQEADTLMRVLASCGEEPLTIAASATTAPTAASEGGCVIGAVTAAEYDDVYGIGETLSARLVEAQPFANTAQLQSVKGIGSVKASAVWEHFCG